MIRHQDQPRTLAESKCEPCGNWRIESEGCLRWLPNPLSYATTTNPSLPSLATGLCGQYREREYRQRHTLSSTRREIGQSTSFCANSKTAYRGGTFYSSSPSGIQGCKSVYRFSCRSSCIWGISATDPIGSTPYYSISHSPWPSGRRRRAFLCRISCRVSHWTCFVSFSCRQNTLLVRKKQDPDYFEIAHKRIKHAASQRRMFQ